MIDLKLSCPAVSQIIDFTTVEPKLKTLDPNSTPNVAS